jgi:hypothetical protein
MARAHLLSALLLIGCPEGPADTAPDSGDAPPSPACPTAWLDGGFRVDPDASLTQIHASAAWDGEAVWVAYAVLEPDSANFDIWATRIGVQGETIVAPFQLDGDEGHNETYPRVAVSGQRVVVAWQADDGTGQDNMDLVLRAFDVDGGDLDASPTVVEPVVNGLPHSTPQTGNGWMPALVGREDSRGLWLAGAWALEGYPSFQTVVMGLHPDGTPADSASVPVFDADSSHYYPSIALGPQHEIGAAWESWTRDGGTVIAYAQYNDDMPALARFEDHDDAGLPFLGWERSADGLPYLVYYTVQGNEYDLVLAGGDLAGDPVVTSLGQRGKIDHTPIVAAGERGAVVAWMRNLSGLSNELVLQPVRLEDGAWTLGEELVLETDSAVAPYLPGLTWLCEDRWFVTWIEGANPDYTVQGAFLRFEGFGT